MTTRPVHMRVRTRLAKNPASAATIARDVNASEGEVEVALRKLERTGAVQQSGKTWTITQDGIQDEQESWAHDSKSGQAHPPSSRRSVEAPVKSTAKKRTPKRYDVKQVELELEQRGLLQLADEVASEFGVLRADLLGPGRTRQVARARIALYGRIFNYPGRSYSRGEVARMLRRDETTVNEYTKGKRVA